MLRYQFPAVKGRQAEKDYYICMIPLGLMSRIFTTDYSDVAAEHRAQRRLNESRIPEICDYILSNRDSYVFSALAASVDGEMQFVQAGSNENVGVLEIDMSASFLINDGQHRKAAIDAAIAEDDSLKDETIAVVLYKDQGLQRSQQMFTDLNKHAVTTSKSLNTLYESKDPVALITKKTVESIPFLRKYTDKEKDNLSKYSSNIFTLNTFQESNKRICKVIPDPDKAEQLIYSFWSNVVLNMREWNEMDNGELSKKSLREDYITTQGLIILALGRLCEFYCANPEIHMVQSLKGLKKIDWLRNNEECWMNRAIKPNGKINRNEQGIFLTYIQIKRLLSLPITNEELKKEQKMRG
jgi:DNA sulfur modification protein DndB